MTSTATALSTAQIIGRHRRPDRDPWFIDAVMDEWWQKYQDDGLLEREMAIPGLPIRASWAGSCARQVAYHVAGTEITNPPGAADAWNFALGNYIHDVVQHAITKMFPGSESEVVTELNGELGSGHADMLVVISKGQIPRFPDGARVAVELKSTGGAVFKVMTHPQKGEGAKTSAILQGALNAAHMDPLPDFLVVPYFAKENISLYMARERGTTEYGRFAAQWTFTQEEFLVLARDEMERLARIVETTRKRGPEAVPRVVPDPHLPAHLITNPRFGTMVWIGEEHKGKKPGRYGLCDYCPFLERCDRDR